MVFALHGNQALIFERLEDPADHFPGTAHDPADLLTRNLDLHPVGIWVIASGS
tara:strand:- start:198 stop:356 length:159 start_codon:yes stop_codon:yes gene_type:complete